MAADPLTPEPNRSRPRLRGYATADDATRLLVWADVSDQLAQAHRYWVGTTDPDGQPHAVPIWGIWLDDTLFFDGAPHARWVRNVAANPKVVVHLESGDRVAIVEGSVERLAQVPVTLLARVAAASEAKYGGTFQDVGCLALRPRVVYAWSSFPADVTRFVFADP